MSGEPDRRRPGGGDPSAARPVAVTVLLAVLTVGVVVYAISLLPFLRPDHRDVPLLDFWLKNALWPVYPAVTIARVVLVRAERLAWSFISAALLVCGAGSAYYYGYLVFQPVVPSPSIVDATWLLFDPLTYVGLVLLLRARVPRLNPAMWLDALLAAFAGGSVAAFALIGRLLVLPQGDLLPALVSLAYPLGDLVLLLLVLSVVGLFGWKAGRAWGLLGVGFAIQAISDSSYGLAVSNGTWSGNTLIDAGWPVASLLVAHAAWARPQRHASRAVGLADLVTPTALAVVALVELFVATLRNVPPVVSVLAFAAVLVGIARTAVTFRQVRTLSVFRSQARTDELTGLPNRRCFTERLSSDLAGVTVSGLSVLLIDLNRFKEVNDTLGHAVGDELLVEVGRRFSGEVRSVDLLARLGGDEFAVLARDSDTDGGESLAARLSETLREPFVLAGVRIHVGASIGVAAATDATATAAELLRRADVAMYRAKADRRDSQHYADALDEHSRDRLQLVDELRTGIAEGQLVVHYQPKIAVASGRLTGVEALVRWQHPERGLTFPDTFLPLAEDAGLTGALAAAVLRTALRDVAGWHVRGLEISVAVNLSTSELLDLQLPHHVAALLEEFGLPGSALVLEITESVFMLDRETSVTVLRTLRESGIRISIDDYGTGYSSLAYLRELPLDELKLDRSFVGNLDDDPRATAIVESTIGLAHSLGLAMVAEGVETQAVLDRLRAAGCDLAQGYHVSRPLPLEALQAWFAALDANRSWSSPRSVLDHPSGV